MKPSTPEVRRLRRINSRIMRAIRTESPKNLRQQLVELASDVEAMIEGRPVADEAAADTLRSCGCDSPTVPCPPPDFDVDVEWPDSAPSVPLYHPKAGA